MFRYERAISEHDPEKDNFYSIIDRSRELLDSNDWWTVNEKEIKELELRAGKEGIHSVASDS